MTIAGYSLLFTVAVATVGSVGSGMLFYGDTRWVTVASQQQSDLRELKREIKALELEKEFGNLSETQKAYLEFLKLQADELEQK